MEQALYRKYRPKKFSDAVGQEHVTKTLDNAIKSGRISHAYLFTGPRGVGKTSVARILAHEINKLPYSDETIHLDIIEIDAASNRRIDEIRELRQRVHSAPSSAKYKVYIIDEVHMLTKEAFNALLKTLEEPPAHCIFVLATTEAHKLPETIISRTQRFEFRPIPAAEAAKHLGLIAKKEKIDIEPEALELLAEYGNGSFRDSISLLDQLAATGKKIDAELARSFLGLPGGRIISGLGDAVWQGESREVLRQLDNVTESGAAPSVTAALLSKYLRDRVLAEGTDERILALLKSLLEVQASSRPRESLEIGLLAACLPEKAPAAMTAEPAATVEAPVKKQRQGASVPAMKKPAKSAAFSLEQWPQILDAVKAQAASLYTALKIAKPSVDGTHLTLAFEFPLHQKKINAAKSKRLVSDIIAELTGSELDISCVVDKEQFKKETSAVKDTPKTETISNIFGSAEVLES